MRDLDALRLSGGARGIDHVCKRIGRSSTRGRRRSGRGDRRRVPIEADHLHVRRDVELRKETFLRDHHADCGVLEHEPPAIGREGWVDRHIGAAGAHDPEEADEHLHGAFDTNRDEHVRTDSEALKQACQSVGTCVELAVGELQPVVLDSDLGCASKRLRSDQLVGTARGKRLLRLVPLLEHERPLLGAEKRQRRDRPARSVDRVLHDDGEAREQLLDRLRRHHLPIEGRDCDEAFEPLLDRHLEVTPLAGCAGCKRNLEAAVVRRVT